eukprot:CAMPEP_0204343424 /NCGR_PEP_ID=MMETSP0469-20131031/24896_1 /ASSEMBLY_ACC=CAM_ASM_000384 /TAXON_ID=2969 /ORGANISM="Oxyrrhis marina" /LENGTH=87 /DNA_ID=CAMNT_0051328525 /DNA_START=682 /DNA_END=943 /DNA_ORIENTATION=-
MSSASSPQKCVRAIAVHNCKIHPILLQASQLAEITCSRSGKDWAEWRNFAAQLKLAISDESPARAAANPAWRSSPRSRTDATGARAN